ncbi:MAG: hypothetical protein WC472_01555 [Candidatus Paceibacterota bacterium]
MQDLNKIKKRIITDRDFRINLALNSFYYFFHIYFAHYIKYDTADFQKEIMSLCQDDSIPFLEVIAFRGSAKSSIVTLAYAIWVVVTGRRHYPIITSDTFGQAKQHIFNLKSELETNDLLVNDFGPFEENEEWTATSFVLKKYKARIQARSAGQKMRGLRHREYRPDVLIVDDIENIKSVRSKEQRDKTERWLLSEALAALDPKAKIILIGNLLHQDSLMMRIKKQIDNGERDGVVKMYPIIKNKKSIWPGRFPTKSSLEDLKRGVRDPSGNPVKTWQREFLLKIVPEDGQIVHDNWIKFYDELAKDITKTAVGVDLAISEEDKSDFTAMVPGSGGIIDDHPRIYILPFIVNKHFTFHETQNKMKALSKTLRVYSVPTFYVEDVQYQKAAIQEAKRKLLMIRGVRPGSDKTARLEVAASYIQNGTVLFPRKGAEELLTQLLGFGTEEHDDLVDAFVYLVLGMAGRGLKNSKIVKIC